jgi:hypothetical protein
MRSANQLLQEGWQRHQSGDLDAAEQSYRQVLAAEPDDANALVYLGIAMFDRRQFEDSVACYRRAISLRDDFPVAWNNLGNSLRMLGEIDEADRCFDTALRQRPGYLSALKNRGTLWIWNGEIERGLAWYREGLTVDPDNAELHRNLGVIHLLLGDYEKGWPEYRWRWRMPGMHRPQLSGSIWHGESIRGRSIFLYPEQGLGDTLQFVRVSTALKQLGARVLVRCSDRLLPLFTSVPNVDQLVLESARPPATDYHASMIEAVDVLYQCTGRIEHCQELFASGRGYLTVSEALIGYWKRWLDQFPGPKRIGINWQGNPNHDADVFRSVPLNVLRPLATRSDLQLFSLQFGRGSEQLDECDFADRIVRLPGHVDSDGGAFTDTTAILKHLDCVVTTDTAIAHLAGAVGAPVVVILGQVPDWRWGLSGDSTAWYPSMTLFRQSRLSSWTDVIEQVGQYLDRLA